MQAKTLHAREAVLASAVKAFARHGYAGTSVQDILEATGLSKPTVYYYFESKAGLFRAILAFAYDESFRLMQAAVSGKTACAQRLTGVASALFDFASRHQDLTRLVFATVFAAPGEIPEHAIDPERRRRNFEFVLGIVREGQKAGELDRSYEPVDLAHGIFGPISHRIRAQLIQPQGRLDSQLAERVVSLFFNGARKRK
jgi:AcrR family transcriptional regulator